MYVGDATWDFPDYTVSGTHARIVDKLNAMGEMGVNHLQVRLRARDVDEMCDQIAAFGAEKVRCETLFVTNDQPWNAIVRTARSKKCDLIVMASHGRRGLAGLLLGSETTKVLTHSKTPVLVCR